MLARDTHEDTYSGYAYGYARYTYSYAYVYAYARHANGRHAYADVFTNANA